MADDRRTTLVRKMIAEGTSDDDIRATLALYDAKHGAAPVAQPVRAGQAESDDPREQIHEPTTFWGGFGKSLLDQIGVGNPDSLLSRAAQPQTRDDIASLLLPNASDMVMAIGPVANAAKDTAAYVRSYANPEVAAAVARQTPGIKNLMEMKDAAQRVSRLRRTPDPLTVGESATPLGPPPPRWYDPLDVGPTRTPLGPSVGRPPTRFKTAVSSPSGAANLEATAKIMPEVDDLKGTILDPTSPDTPRGWESGATGAGKGERMSQAHTAINQEDAFYKALRDQAQQALMQDPSLRELLLARLMGGGS